MLRSSRLIGCLTLCALAGCGPGQDRARLKDGQEVTVTDAWRDGRIAPAQDRTHWAPLVPTDLPRGGHLAVIMDDGPESDARRSVKVVLMDGPYSGNVGSIPREALRPAEPRRGGQPER